MNAASIRTHLLLLVLAVSVPLAAIVGYAIYSDLQQAIAHTKISLRTLASMMVNNTGSRIASARQTLERLAARPLIKQVDASHCDPTLKDLHALNPGYSNIVYTDLAGLAVCSAVQQPGGKPVNVGKTPWFQQFLKEKRFVVGQPHFGPITGKWVSVLSAPIWNDRQELVGAIHLPLDLKVYDPNIPSQFLPAESRYGFFSEDGTMIWRNLDPEKVIGTRPQAEAARQIVRVRDGEFESLAVDGVTRFFSVVPMAETGWIAFVGVPASTVFADAKQRAITASAIALALIGTLVLLASAIARRITAPMAQLERAAHAVHDGDLTVRAALAGPREVAAVAEEFNAMVAAQQLSDERLRAFLDNSAVIAWLKDETGRHIFVSDNFLKRFALTRDAVLGKTEYEIWPQAIADELRRNDRLMLDQGGTIEAIEAATDAAGEVSWWLSNKFVFQGSDGQRLLGGLAVDITARRQAEETLQASEARYRAVSQTANDAIVTIDAADTIVGWNPASERLFGYTESEALGQDISLLLPQRFQQRLADGARPFSGKSIEVAGRRKDGSEFPLELSVAQWTTEHGRYFTGIMRDITKRRAMEDELRKLALAVEQSPEAIVITNLAAEIEYVNEAFVQITGYSRSDIIGKNPRLLQSGKTPRASYVELWEALSHGRRWKGELINRRRDGEEFIAFAVITPLRQADGRITHYVEVQEDITEKKRIGAELDRHRHHLEDLVAIRTSELTAAKTLAEAANRAKSTFLANMSHELRTPLNAILGFTQLMGHDAELGTANQQRMATINRAGRHLLALINDVLEISRIETGRVTLQTEAFHLGEALATIEDLIRNRAETKKLQFRCECAAGLPRYVSGDSHRLKQVLINLLGNAVKYTDAGEVVLRVSNDAGQINFEVTDTGPGISAQEHDQVFQAFYQTAAGIARGEGTGLGLAISREFVRLMGGELTLASAPGHGSTFRFTLPLTESAPPSPVVRAGRVFALAPEQAPPRILIAEDDDDSRELLTQILEMAGFAVKAVADGQQAVDAFTEWQPQFIWMDMRMPVLDGYAATQRIRKLPAGAQVKIVALTASAFEEDRGAILAAGCDDMVRKPLEEARLFAVMGQLLGLRYRYAEDSAPATDAAHYSADPAKLPTELRQELRNAAEILDMNTIRSLIEQIHDIDPSLARRIDALLAEFRFDRIVALCDTR